MDNSKQFQLGNGVVTLRRSIYTDAYFHDAGIDLDGRNPTLSEVAGLLAVAGELDMPGYDWRAAMMGVDSTEGTAFIEAVTGWLFPLPAANAEQQSEVAGGVDAGNPVAQA